MRIIVRDPCTGEDGRTVLYVVEWANGESHGLVKRRFSDFEALHAQLCSLGVGARLPPLPGKSVFALFGGPQLMEERRSAFQSLLSFVGADEVMRSSPAVAAFLGAEPEAPPAAAVPPRVAPAPRVPSPEPEPAPEVVEKATWKAHPFEEALSVLSVSDQKKQTPVPSSARVAAEVVPKPKLAISSSSSQPQPSSKASSFTPFGYADSAAGYAVSGEGIREAIKAGDTRGVEKLLAQGVLAGYVDAQGMSLLHVAALFNAGDIALALLAAGADARLKNAQGESPLDVAPVALAHRMRAILASMEAAKTT